MDSARRMGTKESQTRAQLLDAAERLMLEDGYAAVTSRRVGQKAGISSQLVHYYFATMDDLFLEVFRRRAEAGFARFRARHRGPAVTPHDLALTDRRLGLGVQPRVRRARQPPQGDTRRDRELRRTLSRDAARSDHVDPRGTRNVAGWAHARGRARGHGRRGAAHRAGARARRRAAVTSRPLPSSSSTSMRKVRHERGRPVA